MLDTLSSRPTLPALNARKPEAAPPAAAPARADATVNPAGPALVSQAGETARQLSSAAPVNSARVAELRQALQSGNYPIQPERLADAMIASLKA